MGQVTNLHRIPQGRIDSGVTSTVPKLEAASEYHCVGQTTNKVSFWSLEFSSVAEQ